MKGKWDRSFQQTAVFLVCLLTMLVFAGAKPSLCAQKSDGTSQKKLSNGWGASGNYYYRNGKKVTGYQKIGGKYYYFGKNGMLVKEKRAYVIKISGKKHYFNVNEKGVLKEWTGTAALAAKQLVELKANLNKVTDKKMNAALLKAFLWSADIRYYNNEKNISGKKAAIYYGEEAFRKKRGDCDTRAYALYWMAKVLGYKPKFVRGYILSGSRENPSYADYAWLEIKIDGTVYAFDPTLSVHKINGKTMRQIYGKKTGFKFEYSKKYKFPKYTYFSKSKKQKK